MLCWDYNTAPSKATHKIGMAKRPVVLVSLADSILFGGCGDFMALFFFFFFSVKTVKDISNK